MQRAGKETPFQKKAYRQQAAVELSAEGFSWLAERLQTAFNTHGKIPQETLKQLDWPQLPFETGESGG
jgi:hypothetical protein